MRYFCVDTMPVLFDTNIITSCFEMVEPCLGEAT
jgi:hypothetical protein